MALFTLPRSVNIVNSKLRLLHLVLFLVVLVFAGVNFYLGRQWLSPKTSTPRIVAQMFPSFPSYEVLKEGMDHAMRNSDFCRSPAREITNSTCLPMCPQGVQDWDCIQRSDLVEQPSSQRLMFVSRVIETFSLSTSSRQSVPNERRYWTLPSRNLSMNLEYSYSVRQRGPLDGLATLLKHISSHGNPGTINVASSMGGESVKDLRTIILDAKGQFWRAVSPGWLTLTVPELLELSGDGVVLGSLDQSLSMNQADLVQLLGVKLELEVSCYNVNNPGLEGVELPEELNDLDPSSMCTLRVYRLPVVFASINRYGYIDGGYLARSAFGLDISFSYSGEFEYVDAGQIFINLMACMVALSVPSKVVLFISLHCLGRLSRMYRRVLIFDFDILAQVVGAAARLTLFSSSCEVFGKHVNTNGISLPQFRERLQLALRRDKHLSEEEIAAMAYFCFEHALSQHSTGSPNTEGSGKVSLIKRGLQLAGMGNISVELGMHSQHSIDKSGEVMCLEDFCSACFSAEPFTFTDMAKFFDKDRKRCVGERAFTPAKLWRAVHEANEISKKESDGTDGRSDDGLQSETGSGTSGKAAEDVKRLATSLSIVLDRLSAAELRLAESERSGMAWKQQSSDLETAMRQLEKRCQELEGRIESGVEIRAKRSPHGDIDSAASPDEAGAASKNVTDALDALKDRVVMLERRMAIAAADLFELLHDEKRSYESSSLSPAQRRDMTLEQAHGDHTLASRGTFPSTGFDDAMGTFAANRDADGDGSRHLACPDLRQDYA